MDILLALPPEKFYLEWLQWKSEWEHSNFFPCKTELAEKVNFKDAFKLLRNLLILMHFAVECGKLLG